MILNLEDVKALGGTVTEDHHGEILHLPQGAIINFRHPGPTVAPENVKAIVKRLMEALTLASLIEGVDRNLELTPKGKAARRVTLETDRKKFTDRLKREKEMALGALDLASMAAEEAIAPAEIEPTNAAEAMEDREVRDYWRGLSGEQLMDHLRKGLPDDRSLLALKRSPNPMHPALFPIVERRWEAWVNENRGAALRRTGDDFEAAEWMAITLATIVRVVDGLRWIDPDAPMMIEKREAA